MAKILLVDDDRILTQLMTAYLADERHLIDVAKTGEEAQALLSVNSYDLLILDWNLPDTTGVELCRNYRGRGGGAAVLILSARGDRFDKAIGLDSGADDYFVKPLEKVEFLARVRALLRRPTVFSGKVIQVRDIEVHSDGRVVRDGREIALRPKEFALLEFLARHPNQSFTAETLFQRIWSSDSNSSVETVRMHVMALRKKLKDSTDNPVISSARGVGYKLVL